MPTFTISPITLADAPAIAHNNISAFWPNREWAIIFKRIYKTMDYNISQSALRYPHNFLREPARRRHQKAIDENGALVGYSRWILPQGSDETMWPDALVRGASDLGDAEREHFKKQFDEAYFVNDTVLDELEAPIGEIKRRLMQGKDYMILDYVAVHPDHRCQGIATMLVRSGLKVAETIGLDAFVVAKGAGLSVYQKAGFEMLEKIVIDYSEFGEGKEEFCFLEYKVPRK